MGTRSSRLQEESVCGPLDKNGGVKRESFRRIRSSRPSSLALDFPSSFDRDSEINQSRSEESSDSDTGRRVSPTDTDNGTVHSVEPETDHDDDSPGIPARFSSEETASSVALRASAERLTGAHRHSSGRNTTARSARVRTTRPVSEAWIGLYRVRHSLRCPFCTRMFPGGRIEEHLLTCLTSPPLPYNKRLVDELKLRNRRMCPAWLWALCCCSLHQCATVWVEEDKVEEDKVEEDKVEDWNGNELLFYFLLPQDIARCETLPVLQNDGI
ncbi:hypothetical protein HF521_019301 [Silurus meridionalis]|uniref:RING-type E3 ubiquitin transferase n=1 Tax=Silurus meridionalis TaxID=175797 RepID=A0A8T0BK79_SILME|nr:hypothetical protein HF521_019301 [Silurus meridionalis]